MTNRSQKEMVLQDTLFFLIQVKMKKPSMSGRYYYVREKYLRKRSDGGEREFIPVTIHETIQGQDRELVEARVRQAPKDFGSWPGRKEKVMDLQPRE